MRKNQGKSKVLYYIVGVILLIALGFVVFHELPLKTEHIEEVIN